MSRQPSQKNLPPIQIAQNTWESSKPMDIPLLRLTALSRTSQDPPPLQTETQYQATPKFLYLPFVRGSKERIEQVCRPLGIRTIFKSRGPLWSPGVDERATTSMKEERGGIPGTLCWMWQCIHRRNWNKAREKTAWTQRSSEEEWHKEWHCSTCMEDTAQGRLSCCHSEAGGDKLHTEKYHQSHAHQKTKRNLQPWLWPAPKPSMAPPYSQLPPAVHSPFISILFLNIFLHQFTLASCIIHCHTTCTLTMVFLSRVSFVPVEKDLWIKTSWILIHRKYTSSCDNTQ